MKTATSPALSLLVRDQINRPSPIRQIMKMAEKQNIVAMGLDPAQVISFGGGWVNHTAPDEFRQAYEAVVSDADLFHKSGGYTATLGDMECREQIARFEEELFGVPRLGPQHIAIGMGSTQLTHDLFRTLLDPGDTVMLLDPTYANYQGQLAFSVPGVKIVRLRVLDPQTWSYLPETDPAATAREFSRLFDLHRPRLVLFGAPDNPTSQVVPQALADVMLAKTAEAGAWLVIDAAYKCQYFQTPPAYYAWSPADHPNVVGIHSNSKWARGLGRRLGWIEAQESVIEAIERVQQCSILCPDTLAQMAMARYLKSAIPSGALKRYVADANALYKHAAEVTLKAVDTHLQRPRLTPFGGLYTCVDIGSNAEEFVPKALQATGVLVVPGGGFGESLKNGVRISFGPLVKDTAKIEEGLCRLGRWMKTAFLVLTGVALAASSAAAQTMTPAAGVPLAIATRRAAIVSGLHYELALSIPDALASPLTGWTTIRFDLKDASAPLVLDFETSREHVKSIDANGKPAAINFVNGHLVIPAASLVAGANTIRIAFDAGNASLNRSNDFLYTLFVPARARLAFPVFDQPDLKGRWTVTLEHPAQWQSAANGAELSRTPSVSSAPSAAERVTVKFAQTEPLPTYLVAFVAGDFKIETAARNGRTFRMFHRETDAAKVARNREAIFDLHARALEFLERYTAIPYPFGKFDFVAIPAFQFGGMEHAGKILYNASGLMLDESATQNQLLGRASVIAHETAHMWFGDLVTMRWFNDVWMKEVFANFMAAKIVNPSFPAVNHDLRFLLSHYPSAYEVDRTPGANPIRQQLDNLDEAGSMYGAIIYQKAPVVMRHLEALLGADNFRDGLRDYLKGHAFANATWSDLINVLDARTPSDLQQWSNAWVDQPGRPTVETILEVRNGTIARLAFRQTDPWNRNRLWPQHLRVAIGAHAPQQIINVEIIGREVEVPQATGLPAPRYVLPNGGGWAYGDFVLDHTTLAYLMTNLPEISDPLTRGSAWVTLWDALLDHRVAPDAFFDLAMRALPREPDEQMTSRILGYASNTWWRFLDASARTTRAARFESLLREGIVSAGTASQKAAWFGTLRNVAVTPGTIGWLRQVWEKTATVNGLPLAEADYTALALELAVRQVDGWSEILKTQLTRIENPDRRGRFQFVMPALSADPVERDTWFLSLRDVNNRRREPWVLEGLNYLHHPLRAEASKKYVQPALEMLSEIQKTGDIFFPKRWLDATLGGHQSKDVADTVRGFLKNLPANYPERLKNITLQSADELNRAAGIVKR